MIVSLCKLFKDTAFNITNASYKNTKHKKSPCVNHNVLSSLADKYF